MTALVLSVYWYTAYEPGLSHEEGNTIMFLCTLAFAAPSRFQYVFRQVAFFQQ